MPALSRSDALLKIRSLFLTLREISYYPIYFTSQRELSSIICQYEYTFNNSYIRAALNWGWRQGIITDDELALVTQYFTLPSYDGKTRPIAHEKESLMKEPDKHIKPCKGDAISWDERRQLGMPIYTKVMEADPNTSYQTDFPANEKNLLIYLERKRVWP